MPLTKKESNKIESLINTLEVAKIMINHVLYVEKNFDMDRYNTCKNMYNEACQDLKEFNINIKPF